MLAVRVEVTDAVADTVPLLVTVPVLLRDTDRLGVDDAVAEIVGVPEVEKVLVYEWVTDSVFDGVAVSLIVTVAEVLTVPVKVTEPDAVNVADADGVALALGVRDVDSVAVALTDAVALPEAVGLLEAVCENDGVALVDHVVVLV